LHDLAGETVETFEALEGSESTTRRLKPLAKMHLYKSPSLPTWVYGVEVRVKWAYNCSYRRKMVTTDWWSSKIHWP